MRIPETLKRSPTRARIVALPPKRDGGGSTTTISRAVARPSYDLSSLQREWFPDADAQNEFQAIIEELRKYGEAIEGAGSVPTTLWTMSDADAEALAARIVMFADRYLA